MSSYPASFSPRDPRDVPPPDLTTADAIAAISRYLVESSGRWPSCVRIDPEAALWSDVLVCSITTTDAGSIYAKILVSLRDIAELAPSLHETAAVAIERRQDGSDAYLVDALDFWTDLDGGLSILRDITPPHSVDWAAIGVDEELATSVALLVELDEMASIGRKISGGKVYGPKEVAAMVRRLGESATRWVAILERVPAWGG